MLINQIKLNFTYKKFNLISTLLILFHTIIINFIVTLFYYNDRNILLTIIYEFIKRKLLILNFNE